MFKRLRFTRIFSKAKIRKQLYLVYAAVVVVPVVLIGTFLLFNNYRMMVHYHEDLLEADNRRVKNILFEITTQIYNISESISFDSNIQSLLTTQFAAPSTCTLAISQNVLLDNYLSAYTEIRKIDVYTDNPTFVGAKQFHPANEEIERKEWYQKAVSQAGIFWEGMSWYDEYGNEYWELCLVRKIPLINSPYHAVLVIHVSDDYLRMRLDSGDYLSEISVDQGPVCYSSDRMKYGLRQPDVIDYEQPYFQRKGRIRQDGVQCFVNISALHTYQSDSRLYICTLDSNGYRNIRNILLLCGAVLLLALAIPLIMIHFFTAYFVERVGVLRQEMHKASNQDYELIPIFQGNDELSEAFADLKVMVKNIKEQESKVYEAQIKEQTLLIRQQEMEFKMLASQINPHFLYNTLETIRMKAFTAGDREVATAVKLLGKSMRYVLENVGTSFSTLEKELDHVDVYMMIQHLRFGDRILYERKVEEGLDLSAYQILPLLLQPVVENAIVHGMEEKEEGGLITLSVYTGTPDRTKLLFIDVEDNGCGMTEEVLGKLRRDIEDRDISRSKSIGLYNINQRLKLHYGDGYRIHIDARPQTGTIVRLMIPVESMK